VSDLAQAAALLLAACFAWAGLAKLIRPRRWRASLRAYVPSPLARIAASLAVPALELVAAALLVSAARAGAAIAVSLLVAFTVAIVRARARAGQRLPCACFGGEQERDWRALVARNGLLASAALLVLAAGGASALERGLPADDALAALLATAGLALAAWTAAATRAALRP